MGDAFSAILQHYGPSGKPKATGLSGGDSHGRSAEDIKTELFKTEKPTLVSGLERNAGMSTQQATQYAEKAIEYAANTIANQDRVDGDDDDDGPSTEPWAEGSEGENDDSPFGSMSLTGGTGAGASAANGSTASPFIGGGTVAVQEPSYSMSFGSATGVAPAKGGNTSGVTAESLANTMLAALAPTAYDAATSSFGSVSRAGRNEFSIESITSSSKGMETFINEQMTLDTGFEGDPDSIAGDGLLSFNEWLNNGGSNAAKNMFTMDGLSIDTSNSEHNSFMHEMFDSLDINNDGFLDQSEIAAQYVYLDSLGGKNHDEISTGGAKELDGKINKSAINTLSTVGNSEDRPLTKEEKIKKRRELLKTLAGQAGININASTRRAAKAA